MTYLLRFFLLLLSCWQLPAQADETPQTLDELKMAIEKVRVENGLPGVDEEGKLDLNEKLSELAPEIYFNNPWEKTHPLVLVHLLEHTTGWDDLSKPVFYHQDAMITLDLKPGYRHSRWAPGTRYAYNNAEPAVAAYVVQKISDQLFEDYVQEHFFNPLQMTSTTFFESDAFKERGASLYFFGGKKQPYWYIVMRPAGSTNSSARDLANYLKF